MGHPSLGSWVTYGLGSLSDNLPAFVVMAQPQGTPEGGLFAGAPDTSRPKHQAPVPTRAEPYRQPGPRRSGHSPGPDNVESLDFTQDLNRRQQAAGDSEMEARIASYELAFQMQAEAPDAGTFPEKRRPPAPCTDWDRRNRGVWNPVPLLPGDLERGVRFVQLYSGGGPSPGSGTPTTTSTPTTKRCGATDQPVGALLTDLKRRGLL